MIQNVLMKRGKQLGMNLKRADMKESKIFFGLKSLFALTSSQKYLKVFWKIPTQSNSIIFQGFYGYCTALPIMVGYQYDVTGGMFTSTVPC